MGDVAIIAEALVPTGSVAPLAVVRGLGSRLGRASRYGTISTIAVRHGLGPYLRGRGRTSGDARVRLARSVRLALDEGGVTFVKVGQVLSTRTDLHGPGFVGSGRSVPDPARHCAWWTLSLGGRCAAVPVAGRHGMARRNPVRESAYRKGDTCAHDWSRNYWRSSSV